MSESQNPSVEQLKATYQTLAFIHSIVTQRTQYFPEEFDVAKSAAVMVTEMANKLGAEINSIEYAINKKAEEEAAQQAKAKLEAEAAEALLKAGTTVVNEIVKQAKPKAKRKSKKKLAVVSE